ncbi:response regulator transcription factor [Salirhabdus sp. Marseille-P4669]|uniref:response regulator transcription factor n=1 Tax=Salirhabdus sp. Marseille-P4669 TaxID=2042310 RepID=UPI000C7B0642|nr:LuxR C-terminal-related transcriptional regulator [Salirhabdus sp. Marseille-P4669]
MTLSMKIQLFSIFLHGLKLVRKYEVDILGEWQEIMEHIQHVNTNKSFTKDTEDIMEYLASVFFKQQIEGIKDLERLAEENIETSLEWNPFMYTLLENAVHNIIQRKSIYTHYDHQAVQYLFSTVSEQVLSRSYKRDLAVESFLEQLVTSKQLPIDWAAMVSKENNLYVLEKCYHHLNHPLILDSETVEAESIFDLSEKLLAQMPTDEPIQKSVLPLSYETKTLLICTTNKDTSTIISFIHYSLQLFQKSRKSIKLTKDAQLWKDSVIMFQETMMRAKSLNDALETITSGFVKYLPFERCALFSYSTNDKMGFGLHGYQIDNKAIQNITEDIGNLPIIQNNLQVLELFGGKMDYLQPIYIKNAALGFPKQYINQFQLSSIIIAPIFTTSTNKLLGAAILDQGPEKQFKVSQEVFSALIKFGQSAGEVLAKFHSENEGLKQRVTLHYSPREVEVLKLMAEGASTSEAAVALNLSEYTVRDYISAIMQKMEARNRTEAVARAIRDGVI